MIRIVSPPPHPSLSKGGSTKCVWLQRPSLLITDATAFCEGVNHSQHPQTPDQQHQQAKPQAHKRVGEVENRKINVESSGGSCKIGGRRKRCVAERRCEAMSQSKNRVQQSGLKQQQKFRMYIFGSFPIESWPAGQFVFLAQIQMLQIC